MFTHLRLHSEYSITDGTCRIDDLVAKAVADGQQALAITDLNNLFAAIKFYSACRKAGIKPILGSEVTVFMNEGDNASEPAKVVLLAKDELGYLHLSKILTQLWVSPKGGLQSGVDWKTLCDLSEGLIFLSGAQQGPIGQSLKAGNTHRAQTLALEASKIFKDRFYIELQRCGRPDDETYICAALELAAQHQFPVVATHAIQYMEPEDFEAHEARVCIANGEILGNPKRLKRFTKQQYFLTQSDMMELFKDIPSALTNSTEIATRCNLSLTLGKPQLPAFPTPVVNGISTPVDVYFKEVSHAGLEARLNKHYPEESVRNSKRQTYADRLDFEIETILKMGFPGYFLIVSDFINWAKNNGCPVGPGRG